MGRVELHTYEISCDGRTLDGSRCTSQVILSCPGDSLTERLQTMYGWRVLARSASATGVYARYLCLGHHAPEAAEDMRVVLPQAMMPDLPPEKPAPRCNCTAQGSLYQSGCPVHDPPRP